jgi:hypothetical protein
MSRTQMLRALVVLVAVVAVVLPAAPASADPVTLSGHLRSSPGDTGGGSFNVYNDETDLSVQSEGDSFRMSVEPGTYSVGMFVDVFTDDNTNNSLSAGVEDVVVSDQDVELNIDVPLIPVTVNVVDAQGAEVPARREMECRQVQSDTHDARSLRSDTYNWDQHQIWGIAVDTSSGDGSACTLGVIDNSNNERGLQLYQDVVLDPEGPNVINVVMPPPGMVTLSGQIKSPTGAATDGYVAVYDQRGHFVHDAPLDEDGRYELHVPPAVYDVTLWKQVGDDMLESHLPDVDVTADKVLDYQLDSVPVKLNLVGNDGQPATGTYEFGCSRGRELDFDLLSRQATGTGELNLEGFPTAGEWRCFAQNMDSEGAPLNPYEVEVGATGGEFTIVVPTGMLIEGPPSTSVDDDGVPDFVEAQAPNNGDGNGDGTPDHQQANVTSLPANGAEPGGTGSFMTVAGPAGSTLSDVSTMDPDDAATPPPAGTTLPNGLVNFTMTGVPTGSSQKVSLYGGSFTGVNAYAKYDADTGTWTTLPAGQVQIFTDHVDITITDGAIGDADGAANGSIADPGGVAVIQTGDHTPPVVTGRPTTRPNGNGWYRDNVRIDWSAVDPGSGVKKQPADTVVSTAGSNVTAQSPVVCDKAATPNCGRGYVTGLKIDKTSPSLSVVGVRNGATYTLGSVPPPSCAAADALSGLAGTCKGVRSGGNSNGVGQFTYAATALDKAGNARVVTASYRVVYRFDGFLAPLNDPGPPTSVFKAGSTVPVAFQGVPQGARPTWVSPVRGGRTTLPVNEAISSAKGTSGSAFVWKNGRWQFDWSTKGVSAGYLYRIGVRLDDGTTHYLTIGVR